jgi:heptosyltransferase-2
VVINVHRHGTSGIIAWLSGGKEVVGFDAHPMSFLFDRRIKHHQTGRHEIERNYDLIRHLVHKPMVMPKLYPSPEDYTSTAQSGPFITISPASVWETKRWPVFKWQQLIDKIPPSIAIHLLGGAADVQLCQEVIDGSSRPASNRAGELSFLQSAALMSMAEMNYTNDSAPVHMASAMNAPVTTLFCSTIPAFGYGPLSETSFVFEHQGELGCRPCGIHGWMSCPEGHFRCASIDVDRVADKSLLNRLGQRP